jgi:hypothetical protein
MSSIPSSTPESPTRCTNHIVGSDTPRQPCQCRRCRTDLASGPPTAVSDPARPHYARPFIWCDGIELPPPTSASATEYAPPVPRPPTNELWNVTALETIKHNPGIFRIVTPINVDRFGAYLTNHPNQAFVQSVCTALREGFWPWADTRDSSLPNTFDNSQGPLNVVHTKFVREQRDMEMAHGQFSKAFGTDLLPGMHSLPIRVVDKPGSDEFRLIIDASAGEYSPNSLISKDDSSVHMDGIQAFGQILRKVRAQHPGRDLVVWKSDVSRAYRLMPMALLWQIRQIVTIDGQRYVDRCNQFGNRAGGRVWACFAGLVLWIATNVKNIDDLLGYVDDDFSWDFRENLTVYRPYGMRMPEKQKRLLELWDELGIPHKPEKQLSGSKLTIIGFEVDPNAMTVTIPAKSRSELVEAIRAFANVGNRPTLHVVQNFHGWLHWAVNVYPLLRPGMATMRDKMAGVSEHNRPIEVNGQMSKELEWFARHVESSDGVHLLESVEWGIDRADLVLATSACLKGKGMSFWSAKTREGFHCTNVRTGREHDKAYLNALAVISALEYAARLMEGSRPQRLAICTEDMAVVKMFSTLHPLTMDYNTLLLTAVELGLQSKINFRVFPINSLTVVIVGTPNDYVAAGLVHSIHPPTLSEYNIHNFQPPKLDLWEPTPLSVL